jgi:hypothetical protein
MWLFIRKKRAGEEEGKNLFSLEATPKHSLTTMSVVKGTILCVSASTGSTMRNE